MYKNSRSNTRFQSGFAHMALIVILVVAAGIGSIAYVVYTHQQNSQSNDQVASQTKPATDSVPAAPEIKNSSDLDSAATAIDRVNPAADNQSDLNDIDNQIQNF